MYIHLYTIQNTSHPNFLWSFVQFFLMLKYKLNVTKKIEREMVDSQFFFHKVVPWLTCYVAWQHSQVCPPTLGVTMPKLCFGILVGSHKEDVLCGFVHNQEEEWMVANKINRSGWPRETKLDQCSCCSSFGAFFRYFYKCFVDALPDAKASSRVESSEIGQRVIKQVCNTQILKGLQRKG